MAVLASSSDNLEIHHSFFDVQLRFLDLMQAIASRHTSDHGPGLMSLTLFPAGPERTCALELFSLWFTLRFNTLGGPCLLRDCFDAFNARNRSSGLVMPFYCHT